MRFLVLIIGGETHALRIYLDGRNAFCNQNMDGKLSQTELSSLKVTIYL